MPIREFWNEEPKLLWTYRKTYMDKIKITNELNNQQAWLEGLYFYNAISVSLYNNFGRKETQPIKNYMDKPIDFNKTREELQREEQEKMENQMKKRFQEMKIMLKK